LLPRLYGKQYTWVWKIFTKVQWVFWREGFKPLPTQTQ
jgi:hypothetical protein